MGRPRKYYTRQFKEEAMDLVRVRGYDVARAARDLADEAPVEHIVVFTLTGASVRRVAKYRPKPALIGAAGDVSHWQ